MSDWFHVTVMNTSECLPGLNYSAALDCHTISEYGLHNNTEDASTNDTVTVLPPALAFNENAKKDIIVYSVLFLVAAVGNLTVFITLARNRHRKSRVNLMIMHLSAADLMVTLIMIPLEVGWRITTQWMAGNPACKFLLFLRAFGLYLSSMVLVCISLDRYFAIVHPLKVNDAQRRGKLMLSFAWSIAAVCSLPQSVIFHVAAHPEYPNFKQCVTFGFFRSQMEEMAYNLFCLAAMYFLPLTIIICVYVRILWEISQKWKDSKASRDESQSGSQRKNVSGGGNGRNCHMRLRRSNMTNIERARVRTLRMTAIIVLAFIWCWTPYVVMVMWYMFDRKSAEAVDNRLQDALFIMAVSNSCVNPLVYGTYTINFRNELNRCFGRKSKPAPLSRRCTGSTVSHMRTTVTAQVSNTSAIKSATQTQLVQNRLSRCNSAISHRTTTSSLASPTYSKHTRENTLRPPSSIQECLMLELEVSDAMQTEDDLITDVDFTDFKSNGILNTTADIERDLIPLNELKSTKLQKTVSESSGRYSSYSGSSLEEASRSKVDTKNNVVFRKNSIDSGVYFEGHHKKPLQQNSLITLISAVDVETPIIKISTDNSATSLI